MARIGKTDGESTPKARGKVASLTAKQAEKAIEAMATEATPPEPVTITAQELDDLELEKLERLTVPRSSILLNKSQIIELWENKIFSDIAMIYCAILYLQSMEGLNDMTLHYETFVVDWRGTPDDKGKVKELSKARFQSSLCLLEERGYIQLPKTVVQLRLL